MANQKKKPIFLLPSIFFFFLVLLTGNQLVQGAHHHHHHHHHHHRHLHESRRSGAVKLFVFGDSYADTGNSRKGSGSWATPYGITFPGKPAGRYSDGRVFTDYLASFLRIKSPIAYKWRKIGKEALRFGMNFAYGGTGVFKTYASDPNMTAQIDLFEKLIKDGVYTKHDLYSSIAHVSLAGNDYATYKMKNGSAQGMPAFITQVVNQLSLNLIRIHDLGVRKVAVIALPPLGCLPLNTAVSSFQNCSAEQNAAVDFHNQLLQQAVAKLNNNTRDSAFTILDLNHAFMSVLKSEGSLKLTNPLKPCCLGISNQYSCGSLDEHGMKKYTVCEDPKSTFFWDSLHPTERGWQAVYLSLRGSLNQLYY